MRTLHPTTTAPTVLDQMTPVPLHAACAPTAVPASASSRPRTASCRHPAFMPVGTQGAVKGHRSQGRWRIGAEIILANTYHLYLRPGDELIARRRAARFIGLDASDPDRQRRLPGVQPRRARVVTEDGASSSRNSTAQRIS